MWRSMVDVIITCERSGERQNPVGQFETNTSRGKEDARDIFWMKVLENEDILDVRKLRFRYPLRMLKYSDSPSSRYLRDGGCSWGESDLLIWKSECCWMILGVHSHGDCGIVTTDDQEEYTPVIAPEKDSHHCA
ncbi:hypothetical protein Tco_0309038 [Tanacetum coccineum]